jgi:putative phage-type endonuclease
MIEQRTEGWRFARIGLATASRAKDIMTKGRGSEPSKTRQAYIDELVAERMTGQSQGFTGNAATDWGTEQESAAVSAFEEVTGRLVELTGFITHEDLLAGASPDGLVGDDETLEIKCPFNPTRHLRCFTEGVPDEHIPQIQFQLWITGRKACNFVSYDPRVIDERLQVFVGKVERDDEYIAKLDAATRSLLQEVDETISRLMAVVE